MATYLGWSLGPPLPAYLQRIIDRELCALGQREIRSDVQPQAAAERPESPESPLREQVRRVVRDENGQGLAKEGATSPCAPSPLVRHDLEYTVEKTADLDYNVRREHRDDKGAEEQDAGLEAELDQTRYGLHVAKERTTDLEACIKLARWDLMVASERVASLEALLDQTQHSLASTNERAASLDAEVQQAQQHLTAATEQRISLAAASQMAQTALASANKRIESLQGTLWQAQKDADAAKEDAAGLEDAIRAAREAEEAAAGAMDKMMEEAKGGDRVAGVQPVPAHATLARLTAVSEELQGEGARIDADMNRFHDQLITARGVLNMLREHVNHAEDELRRRPGLDGELRSAVTLLRDHRVTVMLRVEKLLEELGEDRRRRQGSELDGVNAQNRALDSEVTKQLEEIRGLGLRIGELQPLEGEVSALRAELEGLRADGGQSGELSALREEVERLRGCEADASALRVEIEGLRAGGAATEELSALRSEVGALRQQSRSDREWMMQLDDDKKVLFRKWQDARGNFRVLCRARPVGAAEGLADVSFELPNKLLYRGEVFTMDGQYRPSLAVVGYFGPRIGDDVLFNEVWELVECAVGGEDVCVFTYGQTGSGKTMTLNSVLDRLAGALFDGLAEREKVGWRFGVRAQLLEVYGGALYDIAVGREQVKFQSTSRSPTVPGCTELVFESAAEMRLALEGSGRRRTTAATQANKQSSRSHTITLIHLSGTNAWTDATFHATMAFVDLAGTETLEQAGAARKNESQQVSKDLCAVRDVIHSLALGVDASTWRNSLVTQVLRNYMVRRTMVILAISPLEADSRQSRMTLEFGNKLLKEGPGVIWLTSAFKNDKRIMAKASELHDKLVEELKAVVPDENFITQCTFQPMPTLFAEKSIEAGGNVIGLDRYKHDGILFLATALFRTKELRDTAYPKVQAWADGVKEFAQTIPDGLADFVYLNYADPSQSPLASYGKDNIKFMKEVAAEYDPQEVFQKLCPGGYKLSDVQL
ncbi:hypothetical protein SLS64_003531 [Diaporthe eres]